jgi:hypothetical protein
MISRRIEWFDRLSERDPDDVVCELDITTHELIARFPDKVCTYLDNEVLEDRVYSDEEVQDA